MISRVLLPSSVAEGLLASGSPGGTLVFRRRPEEDLLICTGASEAFGDCAESGTPFVRQFDRLDPVSGSLWSRVEPTCHELWRRANNRSVAVPTAELRPYLKARGYVLKVPPAMTLALTVARTAAGGPEVKAWNLNESEAIPCFLDTYDESMDPTEVLKPGWPVDALAAKRITMVGLGSIGSSGLEALLSYGLRRFTLVDPQWLQQRNLARHRLGVRDIGRLKVSALKERLSERYPGAEIEALALDVELHADIMRPLFDESDIIVGCPDGVVPRRVISHLGRRAATPVVLAAVLDDGAIGEILRLRPDVAVGCLTCQREQSIAAGSLELEQSLDPGYREPTTDNPMTAVGGDLGMLGYMAAKVAVATLLEADGAFNQRLPGDHVVVGLRPKFDLAPPFGTFGTDEADGPLALRWSAAYPPMPGCPTCGRG